MRQNRRTRRSREANAPIMQRCRCVILLLPVILCFLCVLSGCGGAQDKAEHVKTNLIKVGLIEPMQHIAVSDITRGISDVLGDSENDSTKFEILTKNANGDRTLIPQLVATLRDNGTDIFVPIFTSTAQSVVSAVQDKPVVFAAVTDPKGAGLVQDLERPGGRITGVSDLWPISEQFDLIAEIIPNANRVGIVYDPSDPSSASTMPLISADITKRGWSLVARPVSSPSEVTQSLRALGNVDVIFTANDVTVTAAFTALVSYCIAKKVPLFAGDYSSVQRGAIAAVGQNYYNVGRIAGEMVDQISQGVKPGDLAVRFTGGGDLHVNVKAAALMGVTLLPSLLSRAAQTYSSIADVGVGQK